MIWLLVQVENQSGLSNFIPIFVGDKETCEEMEILQQKFDTSVSSPEQPVSPPRPACEVLASRQTRFSGFLLDLAWSLKKPVSEQLLTSLHIQRFNYLLDFLMEKGSSVILERVFCSLKFAVDNNAVAGVSDSDMRSLRAKMEIVQGVLDRGTQDKGPASDENVRCQSSQKDNRLVVPAAKMVWRLNVYACYICNTILWFQNFASHPLSEIYIFFKVKIVIRSS